MATFSATTGDDSFSGSTGNDLFNFLTSWGGSDQANGKSGIDTLNVDMTGLSGPDTFSLVLSVSGSFYGGFVTPGDSWLDYDGMEVVNARLSNANDRVMVDGSALKSAGTNLVLDGGAGIDTLDFDMSVFSGISFQVAANGPVVSSYGTFRNFENYNITIGGGVNSIVTQGGNDSVVAMYAGNNSVSTNSGDDEIWSYLGRDTIDGGAGFDRWRGDYSGLLTNLTLTVNGVTGLGTLTGGTRLSGIETVDFSSGLGNDTFNLTNTDSGELHGDGGTDALFLDLSGKSGGNQVSRFFADPDAGPTGQIGTVRGTFSFDGIERVVVWLGADDNTVQVDSRFFKKGSVTLTIDAGAGADRLELDASAETGTNFTVSAAGVASGNRGSYMGFEEFAVTLGGGTNLVTTQAGNDLVRTASSSTNTIKTGAGADTICSVMSKDVIDAGAGTDRWVADYRAATLSQSLTFDGSSGAGSLGSSTTLAGMESVSFSGGSGNDVFNLSGLLAGSEVHGRSGSDTLNIDLSMLSGTSGENFIGVDPSESSSFLVKLGLAGGQFVADGAGVATISLSGGDDIVNVDASASNKGGVLVLDGAAGSDTVRLAGLLSGYSITQDGTGGYQVVDTDLSDGDRGKFVLARVEQIAFDDQTLVLPAYAGGMVYTGTTGNDTRSGSFGDDVLSGLAGDDRLSGLGGNDLINGGAGNDLLDGGSGIDTASYTDASAGVKVSLAVTGAQATGGSGSDTLVGMENLVGSAFSDSLTGNSLGNMLTGGAGNDVLDGGGGADTMTGGTGDDSYFVDNAGDVVDERLGEGKDKVTSVISLVLGANIENLTLGGSNDLRGTGNELGNTITGNSGNNVLEGRDGSDTLDGKAGADTLIGGLGNDTFVVDTADDVIIEEAGGGTDTVKASFTFTLTDLNLEKLTLTGSGAIDGTGNQLANSLTGNSAANYLAGLAGKDTISGGLGNDTLVGGAGADTLTGGGGADLFVFDIVETSSAKDTIKDFVHSLDHIGLDRQAFSAFSGSGPGALDASMFVLGTVATNTDQHLIYDVASGSLYYDRDGAGGQAQVQIALLTGKPALDASDFVLI